LRNNFLCPPSQGKRWLLNGKAFKNKAVRVQTTEIERMEARRKASAWGPPMMYFRLQIWWRQAREKIYGSSVKGESRLWRAGVLAYVHGLDESVFDAIDVLHDSVGKQGAGQIVNDLMHVHHNCAGGVCVEALGLD
jgi:hypothetical protein